jgi:hypothetical protein
MGESRATVQSNFITPPRAAQCAALAVTTTAANQDLRLIGLQTPDITTSNPGPVVGLPGHFARFFADGGDVYLLFSPAALAGGNVPASATTGVNAAGVCAKIASGTFEDFKLEMGVDNFVNYVTASGTATLRIFQSSI